MVDVIILIVATSLSATRLKPEFVPDKEFGSTMNVNYVVEMSIVWYLGFYVLIFHCLYFLFSVVIILFTMQDNGITINYEVILCEAQYKTLWLVVLFGYKVIIQVIGVFLAFKIRKVKVCH